MLYSIEIRGIAHEPPILDIRIENESKTALEQITAIAHELKSACEKLQKINLEKINEKE